MKEITYKDLEWTKYYNLWGKEVVIKGKLNHLFMKINDVLTYNSCMDKEEVWYTYLDNVLEEKKDGKKRWKPILLWISLKKILEKNWYEWYEWYIRIYWIYKEVYFWWRYNIWKIFKADILDEKWNILDTLEKWKINENKWKSFQQDKKENYDKYLNTKFYTIKTKDNWFDIDKDTIRFIWWNLNFFIISMLWKKIRIQSNGDFFDEENEEDIKYIEYQKEKIIKEYWSDIWPNDTKIYYKKLWKLESLITFWDNFTLIRKDLIEKLEQKIWKEKLEKDVEFLPITLHPDKWCKWHIVENYYLMHIFNGINFKYITILKYGFYSKCNLIIENYFWTNFIFQKWIKEVLEEEKLENIDIVSQNIFEELVEWHNKKKV